MSLDLARRWLVARLQAEGKPVEAAIAGSPTGNQAATDEQWDEAARLWIDAMAAVPLLTADLCRNPASHELRRQALEHLRADWPAAQRCRNLVIALLGEPGDVTDVAELDQKEEAARLARYILLTQPPQDETTAASYRRWAAP